VSVGTAKPVIFISYSHKDEPKTPGPKDELWLTFVQSHLQPAVKHGMYALWVDEDIPGGGKWREEITAKLNECDVCVLLVSRFSLASDFIIDVEIETLRKRHERGHVEIFPIVLTPCAVDTAPWLVEFNLRPPNGQPLSDFEDNERNKQMAQVAKEIATLARAIAQRKQDREQELHLQQVQMSEQPPLNWQLPTAQPETIDIKHLPETAYERLVGRESQLKCLDDAWANRSTNILSLVAEGGAGKSALVNGWLKGVQADNYRGAAAVLGWSFYSQGSKERATSAEPFLDWALDRLGVKVGMTSATVKGEAIAEAIGRRRVLLVLDGVEPLQHGLDKQRGELKDQGLRALLRRFAAVPPVEAHGLVVLTSRLPVKDIARWKDSAAPVLDVEQLSDEAGAALLHDNGVWGSNSELSATSQAFGGHPLALGLLAGFLEETQFGDVRRRDHIRNFNVLADPESPRHDHAKRVMESYEREWLADRPIERTIVYMVGLFDRPASADCLNALRRKPAIPGFTEPIVKIKEFEWRSAVARLREVRLLAPADHSEPEVLDAHPLVREWFGARLEHTNPEAWRAAHSRIFDHLRRTTREGEKPTLEDLAPLYQAVIHGCRAGRHMTTLHDIFAMRICRTKSSGRSEFYSAFKLGAFGSDLAALSWFFETPYETPATALTDSAQFWVLASVAFALRAQGRLGEALPALRTTLQLAQRLNSLDTGKSASNLGECELMVGNIDAAVARAEQSIKCADRLDNESSKQFEGMIFRTSLADALHAAGRRAEAKHLFVEAERRQARIDPGAPLLFSVQGHEYCDLLLAIGEFAAARDRANRSLELTKEKTFPLGIALDILTLGRAHQGLAFDNFPSHSTLAEARENARIAEGRIDEAIDRLRSAGQLPFVARGLLVRAAFRRRVGDWLKATRDLDEVAEIAEPGPMRLHLCDMALERARLASARIEAFAPLNGLLDGSPPKPVPPDAAEATRLMDEARTNLALARKLITDCGYHKRDEELAELEAVLAGQRHFADLPPRV
jgi:tetratricopeptide (TPR) repeat protein